jgi:conjugal transfer mating pair stabilization protein TraN
MRARSILLRGMASGAVAPRPCSQHTASAQTVDPKATASAIASQLQGQVTGNVTSQSAPNAVPGYGGADLPQGQYLSNPNSLAGDGAVAAVTSQPYAIVTNPNRPTVDTSTLGLTSAKQVESSPTSYTGIAGSSQGNCQPIPASSGTASTYYDSCQIGTAEADSNFTCTIGWANQFTSAYQYTCHSSEWDIYNPNTGGTFYWGEVSDCGSFASQSPARRSARPRSPRSPTGRPARASAWSSPRPTRPTIAARRPIWNSARRPIASTTRPVLRAAAAGSGAGCARRHLCRANPDLSGLHGR